MECCSCDAIITAFSILVAIITYWANNRKNRKRDSIEYISKVRAEIWNLIPKEEVSSIKNLDEKAKRMIRQKLEYIAVAEDIGYVRLGIIRGLCGKWYVFAAKDSGALDHNAYEKTKDLCTKLEK